MTERVPGLRSDVRLDGVALASAAAVADVPPAAATGVLSDPVLGRRIKLDLRGVLLCRELARGDGEVGAIAEAIGATPDVVRSFAARLVALDLCATPRALERVAERQALRQVQTTPAAHIAVLPGARFACTMCGSCCGGHNVGPVSDAVLDGLDEALATLEPEIRAARRLDKDLFVSLPGSERGVPGQDVMCHASAGSCVFLDDLGKCRIHAKLGGAAKPLPCRIFPWEIVATPTGVRVSVQRECRDFLRATGPDMPPLEEARAELSALLDALHELPAARPIPVLRGQELPSWAAWEALERELLQVVEAGAGDDPAATWSALMALAGPAVPHSASSDGFAAWRARLSGPLAQMLRAAPAPDERVVIRTDALRLALQALEGARGWVLARALGPLTGESARLFKDHLRHALWATAPLRAGSVEAGLGRMAAEWLLARLIAITRAREVKRFHVTDQDLADGLVVASFLFRHDDLQPLLHELDGLTVAVFVDGLATLARAPDADPPDRRAELVKF